MHLMHPELCWLPQLPLLFQHPPGLGPKIQPIGYA